MRSLELHRRLNNIEIVGVDAGLDTVAAKVACFRVELYVVRVRYLLDENYDLHAVFFASF